MAQLSLTAVDLLVIGVVLISAGFAMFRGLIRETFAVGEPDQQGPDESGTGGDRDAIELGEAEARLGERAIDHRTDGSEVLPAGQLRDHAAENAMNVLRKDDQARDDRPLFLEAKDGGGGLVAARLDAEDAPSHRRGGRR